LYKDSGQQRDYSHLSDFLKNQIYRGKNKLKNGLNAASLDEHDTYSEISRKNKYNNALIEKASREANRRTKPERGGT